MEEHTRIFHIKDGVLREYDQTVLKMLPQDINEFSGFDTNLSQ
jgi:hypothetical protein